MMSETNQKVVATVGVIALFSMFSFAAHHEIKGGNVPTTAKTYCAEKGTNGWAIAEARCLRRLNAGVCYDREECALFPGHRYVPVLDSSLDIRCEGDTGGSHVSDFGTTGCTYVGR